MELESEIRNFADDTIIYACDTSVDAVMIRLVRGWSTSINHIYYGLTQWFTDNGMSANPS